MLVDDILATGGSLLACTEVLEELGLRVIEGAAAYDSNIGGKAALALCCLPTNTPHYGGSLFFKNTC